MLIVLMAIVDFSRMKIHAATRWLWLALSGGLFVAAPIGCEDEEPQVLYGPPADMVVLDADEDQGIQPLYGPEDAFTQDFQPEYGPPPTDVVQDMAVQDFQVLYGPPPDYIQGDVQPLYGPIEVIDDTVTDDAVQPLYGPLSDVSDVETESDIPGDIPQTLYGPAVQ